MGVNEKKYIHEKSKQSTHLQIGIKILKKIERGIGI